ncbi:MAG: sulfotransferase, partial [Deltaproteobacteria bacterium]|nr:sulfotransferase [Deltaproteobacteria bacterium]
IFIHGILQRSGTNLLNQALLLHPDCVQPVTKIRENWFLHYSDSLSEYSEQLFHVWSNPDWGGNQFSQSSFFSRIGDALLAYLVEQTPEALNRRLLSKTPSVRHLERCFKFFPSSKVIIIVRDPRDVAVSALKTWGRPIAKTLDEWCLACQSIVQFENTAPPQSYLLIRYEDLVAEPEEVVRNCLSFLNLQDVDFPWERLGELPVFGSSEFAGWQVQKAESSFDPVGRWKSLSIEQRQSFSDIPPTFLSYFGYPNSQNDEGLLLPQRAERLNMRLEISGEKVTVKEPASWLLSKRITALRTGLRFIAGAVLGERVSRRTRTG